MCSFPHQFTFIYIFIENVTLSKHFTIIFTYVETHLNRHHNFSESNWARLFKFNSFGIFSIFFFLSLFCSFRVSFSWAFYIFFRIVFCRRTVPFSLDFVWIVCVHVWNLAVDIIKPKPLPRNIINGNSTQANNAQTINSTTLKSTSETTKTSTNNLTTVSMQTTDSQNIAVNATNAAQLEPAKISKTESLIQRFTKISGNNDATPELMKRISSK